MATVRQKRVAKLKIENVTLDKPLTDGEIVELSGFGPSMKKNPHVVMNSKGVQEELEASGFTEENAMRVVTEIMLDPEREANARLKATDQVFKVRGSYAPEKSIAVTMALNEEHKTKATNAIRQLFSRGDTE